MYECVRACVRVCVCEVRMLVVKGRKLCVCVTESQASRFT